MINCKLFKAILAASACALIMAVSASALTVIDSMDSGKPYNARTEKNNIKEGAGAVSMSAQSGTIVINRTLNPAVDISQYKGTGYIRLYLYIESVANMSDTSGQLELTSSGTCDNQETSWNLSKNMLSDGWNTLILSLESSAENAAELSAINYVRVYIHITGENKIMLDELSAGTEQELGVKVAAVETSAPVKPPEEVYGEGGAVAAAKFNNPAVENTSESEASAEETTTVATSANETSANETSANETSANDTSAKDTTPADTMSDTAAVEPASANTKVSAALIIGIAVPIVIIIIIVAVVLFMKGRGKSHK